MTREDYLATLTEDECKCDCHRPGVVMMHFMECCYPCKSCKKNIKGNMQAHLQRCKKD